MKRLLGVLGIVGMMGIVGCSSLTREEQAALAAEGYYTHLASGEYEQFLEGKAGADSLPDDYREQLLAGYKQFMAQQQRAHQGIRDVRFSSVTTDSLSGVVNVMLVLCFGDSINEEIVVPMIDNDGRWRMK